VTDERPDIEVSLPDGTVSIREVLAIVFYLRKPHLQIASSIEQAVRGFVSLASIQALPYYYNYEGEQEDLTSEALEELIRERLLSAKTPNANIELVGNGVSAPDYYLWYNGKALDLAELADEAGYFWCWVPRTLYATHSAQVLSYISTLATHLPFTCGYSSLALAGENKYAKQALARRYPGLDIAHPGCVSADIDNKAAGSYWLTLLGPEICESLGGVSRIREALPTDAAVEVLRQRSCRIQLSAEHEIGDVNRRNLLPRNRALAEFFEANRTLHVPNRVTYFVDEQGLADREAMEQWHRRFLV
jgi:hypothetical protein